jgi:hypothetical protein
VRYLTQGSVERPTYKMVQVEPVAPTSPIASSGYKNKFNVQISCDGDFKEALAAEGVTLQNLLGHGNFGQVNIILLFIL